MQKDKRYKRSCLPYMRTGVQVYIGRRGGSCLFLRGYLVVPLVR